MWNVFRFGWRNSDIQWFYFSLLSLPVNYSGLNKPGYLVQLRTVLRPLYTFPMAVELMYFSVVLYFINGKAKPDIRHWTIKANRILTCIANLWSIIVGSELLEMYSSRLSFQFKALKCAALKRQQSSRSFCQPGINASFYKSTAACFFWIWPHQSFSLMKRHQSTSDVISHSAAGPSSCPASQENISILFLKRDYLRWKEKLPYSSYSERQIPENPWQTQI